MKVLRMPEDVYTHTSMLVFASNDTSLVWVHQRKLLSKGYAYEARSCAPSQRFRRSGGLALCADNRGEGASLGAGAGCLIRLQQFK
jgi:hypothetical protein